MHSTWRAFIPNVLTVGRLFAVPCVAWLIFQGDMKLAFVVYTIASVTDWFDGFLARRWNAQSRFGQMADPLADKALVVTTYVMMTFQGLIPLWLSALVIGRDIFLLSGSLMGMFFWTKNEIKPLLLPSLIGKMSTFFQLMLIGSIFVGCLTKLTYPLINSLIVPFFIYATAVITLLSGGAYVRRFFLHLASKL